MKNFKKSFREYWGFSEKGVTEGKLYEDMPTGAKIIDGIFLFIGTIIGAILYVFYPLIKILEYFSDNRKK